MMITRLNDIMPFLPSDIKNKSGGARSNLSSSLVTLSQFVYPKVKVEEAQGHAQGGKLEGTTRQAMAYVKGRIIREVVRERFGAVV